MSSHVVYEEGTATTISRDEFDALQRSCKVYSLREGGTQHKLAVRSDTNEMLASITREKDDAIARIDAMMDQMRRERAADLAKMRREEEKTRRAEEKTRRAEAERRKAEAERRKAEQRADERYRDIDRRLRRLEDRDDFKVFYDHLLVASGLVKDRQPARAAHVKGTARRLSTALEGHGVHVDQSTLVTWCRRAEDRNQEVHDAARLENMDGILKVEVEAGRLGEDQSRAVAALVRGTAIPATRLGEGGGRGGGEGGGERRRSKRARTR